VRIYFFLSMFALALLAGCASYQPLTSEEVRQLELNDVRRLCYACLGPHATECDEMYLRNYTRMGMEAMCSGLDDP
jgi:hypothetical protein